MRRNKSRKKTPILSEQEAYLRFKNAEFYKEVYESAYDMVEEIFIGKMVNFPDFEKRYKKTFKKVFNDIYYGDIVIIVKAYQKKYDSVVHLQRDFYYTVLLYIVEQAKLHYCDGINTSQQGCIY
jgi:hypothetical protein